MFCLQCLSTNQHHHIDILTHPSHRDFCGAILRWGFWWPDSPKILQRGRDTPLITCFQSPHSWGHTHWPQWGNNPGGYAAFFLKNWSSLPPSGVGKHPPMTLFSNCATRAVAKVAWTFISMCTHSSPSGLWAETKFASRFPSSPWSLPYLQPMKRWRLPELGFLGCDEHTTCAASSRVTTCPPQVFRTTVTMWTWGPCSCGFIHVVMSHMPTCDIPSLILKN